jgi:type IV secretion system protein VirB3
MAITSYPLFVGATRPTMMWGVSYEALLACFMVTAVVFIGSGSVFTLVVYIPMHAVSYLICMKDPRAFRLLGLWLQTKGRSVSRHYWSASSATPLVNTRHRKRIS